MLKGVAVENEQVQFFSICCVHSTWYRRFDNWDECGCGVDPVGLGVIVLCAVVYCCWVGDMGARATACGWSGLVVSGA